MTQLLIDIGLCATCDVCRYYFQSGEQMRCTIFGNHNRHFNRLADCLEAEQHAKELEKASKALCDISMKLLNQD